MGAPADVGEGRFGQPASLALQWAGVLAGPFAWAVDLTLSYSLVQWTCGGGPHVVLRIITLFSLALVAAGAYASWRTFHRSPAEAVSDGGRPSERSEFMGLLGLLMSALFGVVVIAGAIPRWGLSACQS